MMYARWALALALSVGLVACGGEDPAQADPSTGQDEGAGPGLAESGSQDPTGAIADEVGDVIETVEDTAEKAVAQADDLIAQITDFLEQDKLELAKEALGQLESLQGLLPASYQEKIDEVRKLIEASGLGDQAKKLTDGLGLGD